MSRSSSGSKEKTPNDLRVSKLLLDRKNLELVKILRAEPRVPLAELARRMMMSAPAVRERLNVLEEAGVVAGWRVALDPAALGYPVMAFVRVRPMPGQLLRIAELAQRTPQVVECHRVTGEDCFIMKVHAGAVDEFDALLDKFLAFGQTTTSIVQSTTVPLRELPLPFGG